MQPSPSFVGRRQLSTSPAVTFVIAPSMPAGWLFDRLSEHFNAGEVFKDVDSIELGDDFVKEISAAVGSCGRALGVDRRAMAHYHGPKWSPAAR